MGTKKIKLCGIALLLFFMSYSQKNELSPNSEFTGRTYDVSSISSSPDNEYLTFEKTYQYNTDTIALIRTKNPDRIIAQWAPVFASSLRYMRNGSLFMSGATSAQLVRFPSLESVTWHNITQAFYLEKHNVIIIYSKGTLQIYDGWGELQEQIKDVIAVINQKGKLLYKIRVNGKEFLLKWEPEKKEVLYVTQNYGVGVDFFEEKILIVNEINKDTQKKQLVYVDTNEDISHRFNKILEYPSLNLFEVSRISQNGFLLKTIKKDLSIQNSDLDIWYSNDRNLEKKFQDNSIFQYLIWYPMKNNVRELNAVDYPNHLFFGNKRYLIAYDPTLNQDYIRKKIQYDMYRYDTELQKYEWVGKSGIFLYTEKKGKFILSFDNQNWVLFNIATLQKQTIVMDATAKPYFDLKSETIIFVENGKIVSYDLKNKSVRYTALPLGEPYVINAQSSGVSSEKGFSENLFDSAKPLLVKIVGTTNATETLGLYKNNSFHVLIQPANYTISAAIPIQRTDVFFFVKSRFNVPPIIMRQKSKLQTPIFYTNPNDLNSKNYIQEKIIYQSSTNSPLMGLLYFPKDFDANKKYPMIVGIYELMRQQSNRYLRDGFSGPIEGMNIRFFLDRGYFIYLPDIVYSEKGPGKSALDCVESALDALQKNSAIDFTKVGLIGHSHGGYETNFIATQSTRFVAYVAGAGNSDLVRSYHSFNYNFKSPFYWQFEEGQYRIFKPFTADKKVYIENSPIYHAEKVASPILLWAGTKDKNIDWNQTMEFYLGLRRNKKNVVALFYDGEGHSFSDKGNREDLFLKIAEWFDYFLKGEKTPWVDKMFK